MSEFSSQGKAEETWKSPRKIEEEARLERRRQFEEYMELEDLGLISRELALAALRGVINHAEEAS